MPLQYRRPGVYLEESLLVNPSDVAGTVTVACFVGVAQKGPINDPVRCESWSDFVTAFGSMDPIPWDDAGTDRNALSYLPFAVFSYFQNGGRTAWIIRAISQQSGEGGSEAEIQVNGAVAPLNAFEIHARSVGAWGNTIKYSLATQSTVGTAEAAQDIFTLSVYVKNSSGQDELVETFASLSMVGDLPGTRRVDAIVNDAVAGSRYIYVTAVNSAQRKPSATTSPVLLAGGIDPGIPSGGDLVGTVTTDLINKIEGPLALNICGYLDDVNYAEDTTVATHFVGGTVSSLSFTDRQDIFIINDNAPPRGPGTTSSTYKTSIQGANQLGGNVGDSYSASYGPWLIIPHPQRTGTTIAVPPGGAIAGMIARIDATVGVFRAPAGVIAGLNNAVGVQTKFTETEQGDLNAQNINVIRSVVGAGICCMGGRTRKTFGADRYVSARRTLIFVKEVVKRSTQFAVFENNDQRLWSALRMSAERILRPLWEAGGLAGANTTEAYYIRCDETLNIPSVIQSGEVRMELGVSLEYPAEFVIIRITQFDRGTFTAEVQPAS